MNIEMSLKPDAFKLVQLEFLAGKLFTGQDSRGSEKSYDDLKATYQIAILAKGVFVEDESLLHNFEYYDKECGVSLGGRSRIITVDLAEWLVEKSAEEMSAAEQWAVYFRYLRDRSKLGKVNEVIASEVLIRISRDEVERARLMSE